MNVSKLRKFVLATLMAFAGAIMLPACSSTEEEATPAVPCDIDPGQPECLK